jgi:hypothetical protein
MQRRHHDLDTVVHDNPAAREKVLLTGSRRRVSAGSASDRVAEPVEPAQPEGRADRTFEEAPPGELHRAAAG